MTTALPATHSDPPVPRTAWTMLALGVAAQASATVMVSTPAFLIPLLVREGRMPLAGAGVVAAAPTFGMVLTLVAWGALADRTGERWVITGGLAWTAAATAVALLPLGYTGLGLCFLVAGMGAASSNAASGRVVVGWFPQHRRGLAMGVRQMSQPLGVSVAALTVPRLAAAHGIDAALGVPLAATAVVALACLAIVNPPRSSARDVSTPVNPYRRDRFLPRIHAASVLLVVPQFTLTTFGLVWLMGSLHLSGTVAGVVVAAGQLIGAVGRIGVGVVSDRVGSRVRPLRVVAAAALVIMAALAGADAAHWVVAATVAYLFAAAVTVADNGLAFTAVAEAAGSGWSGRALGVQNTGQFIVASAVGPAIGGVITVLGFPAAFLVSAACGATALPVIPARDATGPEPPVTR